MRVSETGGREVTIFLDDNSYKFVWQGRVRHQHGGRVTECCQMANLKN